MRWAGFFYASSCLAIRVGRTPIEPVHRHVEKRAKAGTILEGSRFRMFWKPLQFRIQEL